MIPTLRTFILFAAIAFSTPFLYLIPSRAGIFIALDILLLLLFLVDAVIRHPLPLVRRLLPAVVNQGDRIEAVLILENPGRRSMRFEVNELYPAGFQTSPGVHRFTLKPGRTARWSYTLTPQVRGAFREPPVRGRTRSLLGLAWQAWEIPGTADITVHPLLPDHEDARKLSLMQREMKMGEHLRRQRGFSTEFYGLREYNPGDDLRMIHWKASARRYRPICRENVYAQQGNVAVLLDAGRSMYGRVGDFGKFDYALGSLIALARSASILRDNLWGIVFSRSIKATFHQVGMKARSPIIHQLYDLQSDTDESDIYGAVEAFLKMCRRRTLLILLTSITDLTHGRLLASTLLRLVPRHQPLLVNLQDPDLDRIARSYPRNDEEAWMKFSAMRILADNRVITSQLKSRGVHVLEVPAERLIFSVVSTYLDLKARG